MFLLSLALAMSLWWVLSGLKGLPVALNYRDSSEHCLRHLKLRMKGSHTCWGSLLARVWGICTAPSAVDSQHSKFTGKNNIKFHIILLFASLISCSIISSIAWSGGSRWGFPNIWKNGDFCDSVGKITGLLTFVKGTEICRWKAERRWQVLFCISPV